MVELYNRIDNPLTINTIDDVLDCYCEDSGFYSRLVRYNSDNKTSGMFNRFYNDKLMVFLFNEWKDTIISYCRNIDNVDPRYKNDLLLIGKYIYNLNPKTAKEVEDIIHYYDENNKKLVDALDRYRWDSLGETSSWTHIDSSYIRCGKHNRNNVEHRLYLNIDSVYIHQFLYALVKKCHERHIKYYFKYDAYGERDDTVVLYTDTKHLELFIKLLEEVKLETKLGDHLHTPPLLTGKVNSYIGYGSEPSDGDKYSFTSKREEHLKKCIYDETRDFIINNSNNNYRINGKETAYKKYIILKMIKFKKDNLLRYMRDDEKAFEYYGYRKSDIEDKRFILYLKEVLDNNFDLIINALKNKDTNFNLELRVNKGTIRFNNRDIENMIKDQTKFARKASSNYKYDLLDRINRTADAYDIDYNNYAFDISKERLIDNYSNNKQYKK